MDEGQSDLKKGSERNNVFLYFAVVTVNLATFSAGSAFAWSSPAIPKLNGISDSSDNPLPTKLTSEESSWVASLLSLGAAIGPIVAGFLADKIGRKKTLILSVIPMLACFTMKAFGTRVQILYVARFLGGISGGSILTVVPMYVGEIAEIHNRGRLGCLLALFMSLGNLFSFSLGPYVQVQLFSMYCLVSPVIFLVVFASFVPESPYYLIGRDKQEEAKKSLLKFRFNDVEIAEVELVEVTKTVKQSQARQGGLKDIFGSKALYKGLFVCLGIVTFQQMSGISVIIFYMQSIFTSSGSTISSDLSTIVVGVTQTVGCVFASAIVEKLGRKLLLLTSACGISITLSVLATYFYLKNIDVDVEALFWLPVTCVIAYIATFNIGFGPMPFTILGEIFPPNVKSVASTLTVCTCLFFSFCTTKFFPNLVDVIGNHYAFGIFAAFTAGSIVFIFVFLPETKGLGLQEILDKLSNEDKGTRIIT